MPKKERLVRAGEMIERVGLGGFEDSRPDSLSGGMRQRVGLARSLALGADILLMDEPFSALDPLIRRELQDELLTLQRQVGKTLLFVTHDLNEALRLGDRIAIMKGGRVVQVGTGQEIIAQPTDAYVSAFTEGVGPAARSAGLHAHAAREPSGDDARGRRLHSPKRGGRRRRQRGRARGGQRRAGRYGGGSSPGTRCWRPWRAFLREILKKPRSF